MARGVNKVILLGAVRKEPSVKYGKDGGAVTTFRMATTEVFRDREGEQRERTEWHRVVFFGRQAEIAGEFLKSGSQVYVEGRKQTRTWEKDEQTQYTTEIVGNELLMLGGGESEQR